MRLWPGLTRNSALAVCSLDPVATVLISSRLLEVGIPRWGEECWSIGTPPRALCWAGANLVPSPCDEQALDYFAAKALRWGKHCSSITGPAAAVLGLWRRLEPSWGPAREIRPRQLSMVIDHHPLVAADSAVRCSELSDLPELVPACVDMFTEELGYSPLDMGASAYKRRIRNLVEWECSFARYGENGAVEFKAEVGATGLDVAQVQGVWVKPSLRGQGLAAAGMAAVVRQVRAEIAATVSLYVNDYNAPAIATYRRVGFRDVGMCATVLF